MTWTLIGQIFVLVIITLFVVVAISAIIDNIKDKEVDRTIKMWEAEAQAETGEEDE